MPRWGFNERDALATVDKARPQLVRRQVIMNLAQPSDMLESRHAHERVTISFNHAEPDFDRPW
jgi:hypothetical protein